MHEKCSLMDWGFYRGAIEDLSTAKRVSRWIKNLSRIYQADRKHRNMPRWIEEALENVLSKNPEILMDRKAIEMLLRRQRAQEKFLNGSRIYWGSIEKGERKARLKGICRGPVKKLSSLKKMSFSRRKNIKR